MLILGYISDVKMLVVNVMFIFSLRRQKKNRLFPHILSTLVKKKKVFKVMVHTPLAKFHTLRI